MQTNTKQMNNDLIQSCIDHIKSAIDVDPWAAKLAEKALRQYKMTAEDNPGLYCDDITFCTKDCLRKSCPRNRANIRDWTVPHSYSVGIPEDCPKRGKE